MEGLGKWHFTLSEDISGHTDEIRRFKKKKLTLTFMDQ